MFVTLRFLCVMFFTLTRLDVRVVSGLPRVSLHGFGASFPGRLYLEWAAAFKTFRRKNVQLEMTYESIGSGQGMTLLLDRSQRAHYAGSDALITNETYDDHPDVQMFPTCAG